VPARNALYRQRQYRPLTVSGFISTALPNSVISAGPPGIEDAELDRVAHGLIGYWNNGEETFNITVG